MLINFPQQFGKVGLDQDFTLCVHELQVVTQNSQDFIVLPLDVQLQIVDSPILTFVHSQEVGGIELVHSVVERYDEARMRVWLVKRQRYV